MTTPYQNPGAEEILEEQPQLKLIRRLVTVLLSSLIIGFCIIAIALLVRLKNPVRPQQFVFPNATARLNVPTDHSIQTVGSANTKLFVVVKDSQENQFMLIYDAKTLTLEQTVPINSEAPQ